MAGRDEEDLLGEKYTRCSAGKSFGASSVSLIHLMHLHPSSHLYQPPITHHLLAHPFDLMLTRSLLQ
jgi:hypothetical protein